MSNNEKYTRRIFGEFPDISIVEMITLQILLRYSKPVIRYVLYIEVNQFLKEKKKLSTSSFYNNLANLERRGYVFFKHEGSSRRILVEPTNLGRTAIDSIFYYFIRNGLIDESQFVIELSGIINKRLDSLLLILF